MRAAPAALLLAAAAGARAGHTFVARIPPLSPAAAAEVMRAPCRACGTDDGRVDVWDPDGLSPEALPLTNWTGELQIRGGSELRHLLHRRGFGYEVEIADVDAAVAAERVRVAAGRGNRTGGPRADWFDDYHPYDEIHARMEEYVRQYASLSHPPALFTIGETYLGRPIHGLRFGHSAANKAVLVQCNIHAREWITPATCMYVTQKLMDAVAAGDAEITRLLSSTYVYLIPSLNRDGYEYTWTNDRMWRKNRQPNAGSNAVGTDCNRNYDNQWGGPGSSNNPSSSTYRGAHAWSCPETRALVDYIAARRAEGVDWLAGLDIHSHGQLILRAYAWTGTAPDNEAAQRSRGALIQQGILDAGGLQYTNDPWYSGLYVSSGVASDYFSHEFSQHSGFTLELRGTPGGFVLPPEQIVPSGEEIHGGFVAFLKDVTASL